MKNLIAVLGYAALVIFGLLGALATISGLIGSTLSLVRWCIENSGYLLIIGVLVYVVYVDHFKKG